MVVIVWLLDLQLHVQSVPITTKVVSSSPVHGGVFSIQQYVIKFVSDLLQVGDFLRVLRFPPQALEFRTPLFPHLVPPAIMVWIFVWKYIFEPFIHILQHFVLQLSRSINFCF